MCSVRVDTQYVALVSHICVTTTKGDSPLEEMSIIYKEGVETAQNQMPLYVVGRSLPPFGRLMGCCQYTYMYGIISWLNYGVYSTVQKMW